MVQFGKEDQREWRDIVWDTAEAAFAKGKIVFQWGFIPFVIFMGMRGQPKSTWMTVINPFAQPKGMVIFDLSANNNSLTVFVTFASIEYM